MSDADHLSSLSKYAKYKKGLKKEERRREKESIPLNALSVPSFLLSFVLAPVGFILGLIARRQIFDSNDRGIIYATLGAIIGGINTLIIASALVFALVMSASNSSYKDNLEYKTVDGIPMQRDENGEWEEVPSWEEILAPEE